MVTMIPTNTNDLENNFISIHPNPSKDFIYINHTDDKVIEQVSVHNRLGQLVLTSQQKTIDTSQLTAGIYFITVKINNQIWTKKLVVQ